MLSQDKYNDFSLEKQYFNKVGHEKIKQFTIKPFSKAVLLRAHHKNSVDFICSVKVYRFYFIHVHLQFFFLEFRSDTWDGYSKYGRTYGKPMWINNLKCSGKESDISSCTADMWQSASCNENCNIGVTCGTYSEGIS